MAGLSVCCLSRTFVLAPFLSLPIFKPVKPFKLPIFSILQVESQIWGKGTPSVLGGHEPFAPAMPNCLERKRQGSLHDPPPDLNTIATDGLDLFCFFFLTLSSI